MGAIIIGHISHLPSLPAIIQFPFLGKFIICRNDIEIFKIPIGPLLPSFVPMRLCSGEDGPNFRITKVQAAANVEEQGGIGVTQVLGSHGCGAVRGLPPLTRTLYHPLLRKGKGGGKLDDRVALRVELVFVVAHVIQTPFKPAFAQTS